MKQKGKAFHKALKTKDKVRLENPDIPIITDETVYIDVDKANEMIQKNRCNRPINWNQVHKFAEMMKKGEWKFHAQGIILDDRGNILTGQKRLMAIIVSQKPQYMRVSRGSDPDTANIIDRGVAQSARDLASRVTDRKHSPTEQSFARAICALRHEGKPSVDRLSEIMIEFDGRFAAAMKCTRGIKKIKEVNMIIAAICFDKNYHEDRFALVQEFSKQFVNKLFPINVDQCWNRGAAFTMAMQKAVEVVRCK